MDAAVEYGYAGIELRGLEGEMDLTRRPEFGARMLSATRADLASRELTIIALGASTRLHEPEARALAAQMDEARRFIDLAHRLGAPWVRVFPDRFVPGEPPDATIARVGANLAELGRFARGSGVGVLVESHGEFTDSASLAAMMKAAGDVSGVGLLWDTHHTVASGRERPADTWAHLGSWIHHTHIKDSTPAGSGVRYVLTGDGAISVAEVVAALVAGGYRGLYGFEWEKRWHPDIAEPDVAFPHSARVMTQWLSAAGVAPR
jgi:sugar phosphate isomerase/epimerase